MTIAFLPWGTVVAIYQQLNYISSELDKITNDFITPCKNIAISLPTFTSTTRTECINNPGDNVKSLAKGASNGQIVFLS